MDPVNELLEKIHAPDWVKAIVDHNRGLFLAMIVSGVILTVTLSPGCAPKVASPVPGAKSALVTRDQLDAQLREFLAGQDKAKADRANKIAAKKAELDAFVAATEADQQGDTATLNDLKKSADAAYDTLDKKESTIASLIKTGSDMITAAAGPYAGIIGTVLGAATLGLGFDNRRKDRVISSQTAPLLQTALIGSVQQTNT